ncbi:MAG: cytochrome c-type biogenesis protein CcmH [Terriglobia bacterium]
MILSLLLNHRFLTFALLAIGTVNSATEQNSRIIKLENALVAPCCYRDAVSRHQSEEAIVMREEIERWVAEGKSDREILDFYKAKYGLAVLAEPEGKTGWVLLGIPFLALLLGGTVVSWIIRRWYGRSRPPGGAEVPSQGIHTGSEVPETFQQKIESELQKWE